MVCIMSPLRARINPFPRHGGASPMTTVITLGSIVVDGEPQPTISIEGAALPPKAYESLMDWFADLPAPKEGA